MLCALLRSRLIGPLGLRCSAEAGTASVRMRRLRINITPPQAQHHTDRDGAISDFGGEAD